MAETPATTATAVAPTTPPRADEPDTTSEVADSSPATDSGGCETVLTIAEVDAFLGTAVQRVTGASKFCNFVFADDAVGGFSVFPASEAEAGLASLAGEFDRAATHGVLLPDGRGFIVDASVVVIGDSGRLFRFDVPDNVDATGLAQVADLLMTR